MVLVMGFLIHEVFFSPWFQRSFSEVVVVVYISVG